MSATFSVLGIQIGSMVLSLANVDVRRMLMCLVRAWYSGFLDPSCRTEERDYGRVVVAEDATVWCFTDA
jgi:hypothetical protein